MADEFVQSIKFKADDSDVKRSLSDIEKRAGSIQIRLKPDPSAARIFFTAQLYKPHGGG